MGPGKDTHGTLGPDQREGRGWPEHSSAQQYRVQYSRSQCEKHPKHGSGAMSIQGNSAGNKSTVDESLLCYGGPRNECAVEMSDSQTDVDGGQECENLDDSGA